jgi:uncharacterized membrane protein (DUF485 family)
MNTRNARIGLVLFILYLVLYGGFVFVNAFNAEAMEITYFGGLNVAILSGFGLIVAALVVAAIYGWLCRKEEVTPSNEEGQR